MTQQLPTNQGVPVTPEQELARCVRYLNLGWTYSVSDILADPAVSRIIAEIEAAETMREAA